MTSVTQSVIIMGGKAPASRQGRMIFALDATASRRGTSPANCKRRCSARRPRSANLICN